MVISGYGGKRCLTRSGKFTADLDRIVTKVQKDLEIEVEINLELLEELIYAALT